MKSRFFSTLHTSLYFPISATSSCRLCIPFFMINLSTIPMISFTHRIFRCLKSETSSGSTLNRTRSTDPNKMYDKITTARQKEIQLLNITLRTLIDRAKIKFPPSRQVINVARV